MKKHILALTCLVLVLSFTPSSFAKQQYNPFKRQWETVPDGSNWSPRYNPFQRRWDLQPKDSKLEYSPFKRKWEWDSGHGND